MFKKSNEKSEISKEYGVHLSTITRFEVKLKNRNL